VVCPNSIEQNRRVAAGTEITARQRRYRWLSLIPIRDTDHIEAVPGAAILSFFH
jgi:hypothetical protein